MTGPADPSSTERKPTVCSLLCPLNHQSAVVRELGEQPHCYCPFYLIFCNTVTSRFPSGVAFLDAKITGWNLRDKKIASQPMTHLRPRSYPFEGDKKKNFVPIYQQSSYKYLIYAEGHCAACRYGFMMQLGSVILKVDSQCVADQMWYFPLLRPYFDHIPVKADLSDLQEKLEWCHAHDEECQQIARRAKEVYGECSSHFVVV